MDRAGQPALGDERAMIEGWLDFHRDALLHKCAGLSADQLREAAVPPSPLTLLGLVRHVTELELYLAGVLADAEPAELYSTEDDPDGAFAVAGADAGTDLARFRAEVDRTRSAPRRSLDDLFDDEGDEANVRSAYMHVLEEYARHNGHADLIRERIDGAVGT